MKDPKRLVEQGYDAMWDRYAELASADEPGLRMQHVAKLAEVLPCRV